MKSDVILQALQNLIAASDGMLSGTQFKDALDAARAALKAPAERKIVQIQIIKSEYGNAVPSITALCNDGTLWVRTNNHWYQIDGIPEQPEQTSGCSS